MQTYWSPSARESLEKTLGEHFGQQVMSFVEGEPLADLSSMIGEYFKNSNGRLLIAFDSSELLEAIRKEDPNFVYSETDGEGNTILNPAQAIKDNLGGFILLECRGLNAPYLSDFGLSYVLEVKYGGMLATIDGVPVHLTDSAKKSLDLVKKAEKGLHVLRTFEGNLAESRGYGGDVLDAVKSLDISVKLYLGGIFKDSITGSKSISKLLNDIKAEDTNQAVGKPVTVYLAPRLGYEMIGLSAPKNYSAGN